MTDLRKIIVLCLFFLFPAVTLFGKTVEITFWHSLGYHVKAEIDEMVRDFNESHRDIRVQAVYQGYFEDVQVKMLAAAVTRQLPDVAQVPLEFLQAYIDNDLIAPIDGDVPREDAEDILPQMWEPVTRNGHIYGVPFCMNTDVFFYNEDLFREIGGASVKPPQTWEELLSLGEKLTRDTDGDGEPDIYGLAFYLNGFYGMAPLLWANGGHLFSEDGRRVMLDTPEMRATILMIHDLVFGHTIMPRGWTDWESGQAFLSGKIAMGWFTSAAIPFGEKNLPWTLRITDIPRINGSRYTILGGSALVTFTRDRKKRAAAREFVLWCTNKMNNVRLYRKVGFVPVRRSAIDSLEIKAFIKQDKNYRYPLEALSYARPLPHHPEFLRVNQELRDMLQRIILQGADPIEELRKTEKAINAMLEEQMAP